MGKWVGAVFCGTGFVGGEQRRCLFGNRSGLAEGLTCSLVGRQFGVVPFDGSEFVKGGVDGVPEVFSSVTKCWAVVECVVLVGDCC